MKNILQEKHRFSISHTILFFISAFVFMLFFAYNTSPLISRLGEDSSMYLYIGRAMVQGKTLYTDLFDHKGPIIFFINAFAQLFINGTLGVWIIEFLCMFFSMLMIHKICLLLGNKKYALFAPLVYLCLFTSLINGGNYTEEYSNIFSILSIYIFTVWNKYERRLKNSQVILLGISFAFAFFLRPNNIAVTAAAILFICIYTLKNDKKLIPNYIMFGLIGVAIITIPIFLYSFISGNFSDMMNATLLHNLKYCKEGYSHGIVLAISNKLQWITILAIVIINISSILSCISTENYFHLKFIAIEIVFSLLAIFNAGRTFIYYYVLILPITVFSLGVLIQNSMGKKSAGKTAIAIILSAAILLLGGVQDYKQLKPFMLKKNTELYNKNTKELLSDIPTDEYGSFFAYDIPAIGLYNFSLPAPIRYFTMQSWMNIIDPSISETIIDYLKNNDVKWIMKYNNPMYEAKNVSAIIDSNYEKVKKNNAGTLYKRINNK